MDHPHDPIRPEHYRKHPSGVEAIELCELLGFNLGNALKYLMRADHKGQRDDDRKKAAWYLRRQANRLDATLSYVPKAARALAERIRDHENRASDLACLLDMLFDEECIAPDQLRKVADRLEPEGETDTVAKPQAPLCANCNGRGYFEGGGESKGDPSTCPVCNGGGRCAKASPPPPDPAKPIHDPDLYKRMCEPRSEAEADASYKAFYREVSVLRERHRIRELAIVAAISVTGHPNTRLYVGSRGDSTALPSLVAVALGNLRRRESERLDALARGEGEQTP